MAGEEFATTPQPPNTVSGLEKVQEQGKNALFLLLGTA